MYLRGLNPRTVIPEVVAAVAMGMEVIKRRLVMHPYQHRIREIMSKTHNPRYFITTPIYYVNDVPHIGHAYTTIAADVMARYRRLRGDDVFFLTGSDEHGLKIEKAAEGNRERPIDLADRVVTGFMELWKRLNISTNDFIRTTEERHKITVQHFFEHIKARGDIYLGEYRDWYCIPCESFWTDTQLIEGKCPDCKRVVEKVKEESYFFRMSRYQEQLLDYIEKNPDFIQPSYRKNEVVSFVKSGLRDLSISRTSFKWGIPVPGDERHVIYVWFDALVNYITAAGYPGDMERFNDTWPADLHLVGKDILRFHAIYWPTFLMAAGLPLPKKVFAHGWWTVEGEKMSKSKGNVVDPNEIIDRYGVDQFRYFLLREVPFGLDGDFSTTALVGRINGELANDLGNLLSRSIAMTIKYFDGVIPAPCSSEEIDRELIRTAEEAVSGLDGAMKEVAFQRGLTNIWSLVSFANKYIETNAPWALAKDEAKKERLQTVIYNTLESLRVTAILISPFMPDTAAKMWEALNIPTLFDEVKIGDARWGGLKTGITLSKPAPLFPRIEEK